nr:NADH dehydrogenase subunit 3 [Goniodes ortygis]
MLNFKKDAFECGMEPMTFSKSSFCMHFFPVGVLFLLFDVEMIVCIPLVGVNLENVMWEMFWLLIFSLLFIGLIVEIMVGTVDWKE